MNFSKKGVGISTGVKGARFVVGPAGTYVHLGRNGFYYKKYLGKGLLKDRDREKYSNLPHDFHVPLSEEVPRAVETNNFDKLTDSESTEFIRELQDKHKKIRFFNIFGIVPSLIILVFIAYTLYEITDTVEVHQKFATIRNVGANIRDKPTTINSRILDQVSPGDKLILIAETENNWLQVLTANNDTAFVHGNLALVSNVLVRSETVRRYDDNPNMRYIFFGLTFIPLLFWNIFLYRQDQRRKSTFISYELDEFVQDTHKDMIIAFKIFANSKRKWQIISEGRNDAVKYNAGADVSVDRKVIREVSKHKLPSPFFKTNIEIPFIGLQNTEFYFLPDRLLLKRNNKFAAVQYSNLDIDIANVNFREYNRVPSDATVADYTYHYVNKDGGPDRRFSRNPRIPICTYSEYHFRSDEGVNEKIMPSRSDAMDEFIIQLKTLAKLQYVDHTDSRQETEIGKNAFRAQSLEEVKNTMSREYYDLLVDFSEHLFEIVVKLKTDDKFIEKIKNNLGKSTPESFIQYCVMFDLTQTIKLLTDGNIKIDSVEMIGLVLLSMKISGSEQDPLFDYETTTSSLAKGIFQKAAEDILEACNSKNPVRFTVRKGKVGELTSEELQSSLSLPTALKIIDHPLFDDYVTTIYRFATIIAKADGLITKKEETALKSIYQLTHHPIPVKESNAVNVSEVNEVETLDEVLKELDSLIGLNEVKNEVRTLINFVQIQKEREKHGLKRSQVSYHCVFTGSPGTGKTTIARLIAKIYKHLGVLEKGHLVETDRSGLVAEYLGQTSGKVDKVVGTALDGILFIDEAYSLVGEGKDDYGREAVAAIVKRMEDNRDRLILIVAGYKDEMKKFIDTNTGFRSRFNRYIQFSDYTPEELVQIFELFCSNSEYVIAPQTKETLADIFRHLFEIKTKDFGNGRLVRNIFEKSIENQSNRIAIADKLTKELLTTLEPIDIPAANIYT